MTAREQARNVAISMKNRETLPPYSDAFLAQAADAASDVWEPLLRELHDAFGESTVSFVPGDPEQREQYRRLITAWIKVRRALGVEDD